MLIGRCAWHPQYFGYPRWRGVRSWRGWNVRFTDGICERCLGRFRAEYREYLERVPPTKVAATLPAARPVGAIRVPVSDPVRAA